MRMFKFDVEIKYTIQTNKHVTLIITAETLNNAIKKAYRFERSNNNILKMTINKIERLGTVDVDAIYIQ